MTMFVAFSLAGTASVGTWHVLTIALKDRCAP